MSVVISNTHKQDIKHYEELVSKATAEHGAKIADLESNLEKSLAKIARDMWLDGYQDTEIAKVLGKSGKGIGGKWVARGIADHAGLDGASVFRQASTGGSSVTSATVKAIAKKSKSKADTAKALSKLGVETVTKKSGDGQGNKRTPEQIALGHMDSIISLYMKKKINRATLDDIIGKMDKLK